MNRDNDISYFVAFCIEQYKNAKGISGDEAASLLFSSGVASYLADNFEVLHTQSRQWLIEEIDEKIGRRNFWWKYIMEALIKSLTFLEAERIELS